MYPTILVALTSVFATSVSAALCPSFTLTADAPGQAYDGQRIIESGRSTYIGAQFGTPVYPDSWAIFFRNDTTHLYGARFNVSYDGGGADDFETPPFLFTILIDEGFPIFTNASSWYDDNTDYTSGSFNVTEDGYVGFVPKGANSSVGGWWVCEYGEVILGGGKEEYYDECLETRFKMSDVNVTEADFC